jgi:hypothetical protein
MANDDHRNIERETLVVSTEDGLVMTGTRAKAFEQRVIASVRKPFFMVFGLIGFIFILLLAGSLVMTRFSHALNELGTSQKDLNVIVTHTDAIATNLTGPEAVARQQANLKALAATLDCQQQKLFQRYINTLAESGISQLAGVNDFVDPQCR